MRWHQLLPKLNGVPVLMYHNILPDKGNKSTVTPNQLRNQWTYLKENNYVCLSLNKFLSITFGQEPAPKKGFLLTFDDGYTNTLKYAYPMLKEFGWNATFFLIGSNLKKNMSPKSEIYEQLNSKQLSEIDPNVIQFAMHGYDHEDFSELSITDAQNVIRQMIRAFDESGLQYYKVLAYPYGAIPKFWWKFKKLESILQIEGIEAAFRIGNKPQLTPAINPYKLKRIDICGNDTKQDFVIKLEKGKLKPF